jgi:hypothetical protein
MSASEDEVTETGHAKRDAAIAEGVATVGVQVSDRRTEREEVRDQPAVPRIMADEAPERVGQETHADDEHILEQNVHRVFRLRESGLKGREAEMHDEHERGRDHRPEHARREEVERIGRVALLGHELIVGGPVFIDLAFRRLGHGLGRRFNGRGGILRHQGHAGQPDQQGQCQ